MTDEAAEKSATSSHGGAQHTFPADWGVPLPAEIPRPTYFPASMALGLTLLFWGLITSPVVLGAGVLVVTGSLIGWIGEMRHER